MESGEAKRVERVVAQGLLNRRVAGHAPETRRRTGSDRRIELCYAATAQFFEAVASVLPYRSCTSSSTASPCVSVRIHPPTPTPLDRNQGK
jgi:hypothetical protein